MKQNVTRHARAVCGRTFMSFTARPAAIVVLSAARPCCSAAFMVFRWASTPDLRAALQQPRRRGRLRGRRQARRRGRDVRADRRRQHRDGAPGRRLLDADHAQSGEGLPANSGRRAATRCSTTRASRPPTSRSRPTTSGRWRASSPRHRGDRRRQHRGRPPGDPGEGGLLRRAGARRPRRSWSTPGPASPLDAEQVQAIVHLVASQHRRARPRATSPSPTSTGKVLSTAGRSDRRRRRHPAPGGQRLPGPQDRSSSRRMLDRVVGPGNSTVQVTADLDFDNVDPGVDRRTTPRRRPRRSSDVDQHGDLQRSRAAARRTTRRRRARRPDGHHRHRPGRHRQLRLPRSRRPEDNAVETVTEHREAAPGQRPLSCTSVSSLDTVRWRRTSTPARRQGPRSPPPSASTPTRGDTVDVDEHALRPHRGQRGGRGARRRRRRPTGRAAPAVRR